MVLKLAVPILILPYLTRKFSVSLYGTLSFVKAYCVYVQLIVDFGFLFSATREIALAKGDCNRISEICGDTLIEKLILSCVVFFITLLLCLVVPIFKEYPLFTLTYCISCITSIGIMDFLYRGIEKMKNIAIPLCFAKLVSIFIIFNFVTGDDDLIILPIAEIVSNVIVTVLSFKSLKLEKISIRFTNYRNWMKDLKLSSIYFASNFATTFVGALTTLVAGLVLSKAEVAFWSICILIVSAVKAVYSPIANGLYPYMVQFRDLRFVNKISVFLSIIVFIFCFIIYFFGDALIIFVVGDKYNFGNGVVKYFIPTFLFGFYSIIYGWPVLGAIDKVSETTRTTIVAAIIQIAGIVLLYQSELFTLVNLAICCGISEGVLLVQRIVLIIKNKEKFNVV